MAHGQRVLRCEERGPAMRKDASDEVGILGVKA